LENQIETNIKNQNGIQNTYNELS